MPWKIYFPVGFANFLPLLPKFFFILFFFLFLSKAQSYERIISLKPNLTEILFALGVGNKIVGVTTYCDYPPEAKKIDKVSDYLQPDLEKLLAKSPDLIITSTENSSRREIDYLRRKGYRVLTYQTDTLSQLRETLLALGTELNKPQEAQKILAEFDAELLDLQNKVAQLKKQNISWVAPRTLFIVGEHPLIVAGSGNMLNDIAPYLGLQNGVKESRLKYPNYSIEQVYAMAPQYILDFSMGSEASKRAQQEAQEELEKLRGVPAIQNKQIYFWDIGTLRASPRLPRELHKLFDAIHGRAEFRSQP